MKYVLIVFYFLFFSSIVFSQEEKDSIRIEFHPNSNLNISISRFDNSDIEVDGILDELVWDKATLVGNFTEIYPGDLVEPEVQTEVLIFYDLDNIYFSFICYDDDMSELRSTFSDRDKIFKDDYVGFYLNTYSDDKQAYKLLSNPYGIQGDLIWTPDGEDASFDAIWESDAKIYNDKWICEFAIPFKSIRFPDKSIQEWNVHLFRIRPRESKEKHYWVPLSQNDPSLFTKSAKLKGMKNIKGGSDLEVLPYILGSRDYHLSDDYDPNSDFISNPIKGELGVNLKYGITSNLTTEVTINPDFSQVEADAGRVDINTSFALFYPEKRPFFLEGISIFNTPINVIYTRSINNPLSAAKLTGKVGDIDIGYILAYDEQTPFIIPLEESSTSLASDRKSLSNIFRLKYSLKDDSYIGIVFTDREVKDTTSNFFKINGYNRVFGIDGSYRFLENYSIGFQLLGYNTKEVNDTTLYSREDSDFETFDNGKYTAAFDGESFSGFGGIVNLKRVAKYWEFYIEYFDQPPVARVDNGYIRNNDFRYFYIKNEYNFHLNNNIFEKITPDIQFFVQHDYNGRLKEIFIQPDIIIKFNKQIYFMAGLLLINNEEFDGIYHRNVRRGWIDLSSYTFNSLRFGLSFETGNYIVRFEEPSFVGYGFDFKLWSTIKPVDRLLLENNYVYSELSKSFGGEKLYTGYILRNKTTYQFNKNLFFRLILEYNTFTNKFNIDPLVSFKLNPFSIFYIGSTHQISELEENPGKSKLVESERQIFLKFQYLLRL